MKTIWSSKHNILTTKAALFALVNGDHTARENKTYPKNRCVYLRYEIKNKGSELWKKSTQCLINSKKWQEPRKQTISNVIRIQSSSLKHFGQHKHKTLTGLSHLHRLKIPVLIKIISKSNGLLMGNWTSLQTV